MAGARDLDFPGAGGSHSLGIDAVGSAMRPAEYGATSQADHTTYSSTAVASLLRRSHSAAGADRLGFGGHRSYGWHDARAYESPRSTATTVHLCALDLERRLAVSIASSNRGGVTELSNLRADLAEACDSAVVPCRRGRRGCSVGGSHRALTYQPEVVPLACDRGTDPATAGRSVWKLPWRRSRPKAQQPMASPVGAACSLECGEKASEEYAVERSKQLSRRKNKVRRKCSQFLKAVKNRLRRKGSSSTSGCGKHARALAAAHNGCHTASANDVSSEQSLVAVAALDSAPSSPAESGLMARTAASAADGWQWHRGSLSTPAAVVSTLGHGTRELVAARGVTMPAAEPPLSITLSGVPASLSPAALPASLFPALQSSGVRAHTTVDYAHFLVPDLGVITNSAYYWCVMDRYEAERALEGKPEGTFLLRDSAQDDFLFSVSFRRYGRSLHARVEQRDHSFSFDAHDVGVFRSPSVTGLVEHYKDADSCLFFEPLLTRPLPRPQPLSLLQLARAAICGAGTTYDGVGLLPLPRSLVEYVRYYHYKHKIRSRALGAPGAVEYQQES